MTKTMTMMNEMYPVADNKNDCGRQGFLMRTCPACGHTNTFPAYKIKVRCEKCQKALTISKENDVVTEDRK